MEKKKVVTIGEILKKEVEDDNTAEKEKEDSLILISKELKKEKYLARPDVEEALNVAADLAALYKKPRLSLK